MVFGLLAGWLPALAAAAVGALALWRPSWRRVLVWVPPAFLLATAGYVVAKLLRYDIPPTIDWPNEFEVDERLGLGGGGHRDDARRRRPVAGAPLASGAPGRARHGHRRHIGRRRQAFRGR